jgi:hypothetical protein
MLFLSCFCWCVTLGELDFNSQDGPFDLGVSLDDGGVRQLRVSGNRYRHDLLVRRDLIDLLIFFLTGYRKCNYRLASYKVCEHLL